MFYSKNKFEKLVHLVGFIIRIYYSIVSTGLHWATGCLLQEPWFDSQQRQEIAVTWYPDQLWGTHTTSHSMGNGGSFNGHKAGKARYEADHAHQRKAGTCCHQNAAARAEMVLVNEVFALLMNKHLWIIKILHNYTETYGSLFHLIPHKVTFLLN